MSKYMYIKEIKRKISNSNVYFPLFFTHSHCTKKKKKPKQKKIVGGIELYGHTCMLNVGQVCLFRFQSIKKFMPRSRQK